MGETGLDRIITERLQSKDRIIANRYGPIVVLHYDEQIWSYNKHLLRVEQAMADYEEENKAEYINTFRFLNRGWPESREVLGMIFRLPKEELLKPSQDVINNNFTSLEYHRTKEGQLRLITADAEAHQGIALSALDKDFTMPIAVFANIAIDNGLRDISVMHEDGQMYLSLFARRR